MIINKPTVSVVIPTYDRGHVIRRALHSVLNQTYRNLEVIVVDDGSTDDTETIVKSFGDARVRYIRHEVKQGAAVARNTGIRLASSEFIAFQDSDDEWLCEKLEKQMVIFQRAGDEVGVVYTGFVRLEDNRASYWPQRIIKKSGHILESLLHRNFVTTQAVVVRRECFAKAGLFDEQLPRFQDWELFIRIAEHYAFVCIDEPLLIAFHSATSITADDSLYPVALRMVLLKHEGAFVKCKSALASNYYYLGKSLCASNEIADGIECLLRSLRHNPLRIMCWVSLLTALLGCRFFRFSSNLLDKVDRAVRCLV